MKKLIIFISALALISSCAKIEVNEPNQNDHLNDSATLNGGLPEVLYASVSDESRDDQTRTYVDGKSVKWHRGESISYFAGTYANVKYTMENGQYDGTVNAKFVKNGDAKYNFGGANVYNKIPTYPLAIYPYRESHLAVFGNDNSSRYNFSVNYAKEQTYAPNSFGKGANVMVATGSSNDDDNLYFRHACGYLVIKLYGADTKVSNITLTALGEGVKISGEATLIVEQNEPVRFNLFKKDAAYNTVSLDCSNGGQGVALGADAENATEFWFALPPVTITGGFKITVTDTKGYTYTKQTTKDVVISRNEIQPMAALQFVAHTPPLNKIWYTKVADSGTSPITFGTEGGQPFDATIKENGHYYDESTGKFVIEFDTYVKIIKAKAFYGTAIQTIELPGGLETIEEKAFADSKISAITIPGSVTKIGNLVFVNCTKLSSVTINDSSTALHIGFQDLTTDRGPFWDSPLTSITLNRELVYDYNDLDATDEGIFSNKHKNPTTVSLGGSLRTILPYMFSETGVGAAVGSNGQFVAGSVWIPHTITSIGDYAFNDCDKLAGLTLGYDGTTDLPIIGGNVFNFCDSFNYIKVRKNQLQKFKDSDRWNDYEAKLVTSDDFQ